MAHIVYKWQGRRHHKMNIPHMNRSTYSDLSNAAESVPKLYAFRGKYKRWSSCRGHAHSSTVLRPDSDHHTDLRKLTDLSFSGWRLLLLKFPLFHSLPSLPKHHHILFKKVLSFIYAPVTEHVMFCVYINTEVDRLRISHVQPFANFMCSISHHFR